MPSSSPGGVSYEKLWDIAEMCWDKEAQLRPFMKAVAVELKEAASTIMVF